MNNAGHNDEGAMVTLPWFAVQVHAGRESGVAARLTGQGYEYLLPTYKEFRQWSDRKKELELALFPGYLFSRFDPMRRLPVLKTPGVIQIVGYNRTPVAIAEKEIEAIRRMMNSQLPARPWPYFEIGDRVQILSGALRGIEGILVSKRGRHRLVLSVSALRRSVAVELDSTVVRRCGTVKIAGAESQRTMDFSRGIPKCSRAGAQVHPGM